MKYGFFDDTHREYVITTPATPLPWINYLGNEDFFSLISNTLGGYSFYKDAKLTAFVPLHQTCEVNHLILTNQTDAKQELTLTSYVEFCFWNAVDDSTNFQRNLSIGEVEICGSEIYHKTEYRERRNHYAYYTVNAAIDGFDTSRDAFLGVYGSIEHPKAVMEGTCSDSAASGGAVIGSHQLHITLKPGESKSYIFLLGYAENPSDDKWESQDIIKKDTAKATMAAFATDAQVTAALDELKDYWTRLLSSFSLQSPDVKLDCIVNIWNQYQCMVTFHLSRSASYFESGIGRGMGFRDSCQDLLGFVHLIPDRARQRILDIAATQSEDGSAYHQYQPLTKKGNSDIGSGFNDDPLWLIAGTAAYIKETGNLSILDEIVDFNNDPALSKPLLEHMRRYKNAWQ